MRVALGCLALAALSLLVFREPTYDPTAWLIWGRQIAHGTLDTVAGPSWKPLPVLVTTPFSVLGDTLAPKLWLVVARTGGLLSLVMVYRVAGRLGGRAAAAIALAGLVLATEYEFNWIRGDSEGLLVALSLLGVDRHLDGRYRSAFGWGVAAALLRPDVWLPLVAYGLWLQHRERDWRTAALVLGAGAGIALLWFVPEYLGSGNLLRGAARAREPVEGSPGASAHPFTRTFSNAADALTYAVYPGAVLALAVARRDRAVAALAAAAALLLVVVAVLAQSGFTGNLRYLSLPAALVCVLGGVGWAWLAGRLAGRARLVLALAAAAAAPGVVAAAAHVARNLHRTRVVDRTYAALPGFIAQVGGREAILRCGQLYTGPFQTQLVAYRLHLHQSDVGLHPGSRGAILQTAGAPLQADGAFKIKRRGTEWTLLETC